MKFSERFVGGRRRLWTWQGRISHSQDQRKSKVAFLRRRHAIRCTLGFPRSKDRFRVLALGFDFSGTRSRFRLARVIAGIYVPLLKLHYYLRQLHGFQNHQLLTSVEEV